MTLCEVQNAPSIFKQSRTKLWIRTLILTIFGTLFGIALFRDLNNSIFLWSWGLVTFIPSIIVGYWMRRLVPMQVHLEYRCITFSFDRIYFSLILILVIAKTISNQIQIATFWADIIMCIILGLMIGRLSGICLRVRNLKKSHHLVN